MSDCAVFFVPGIMGSRLRFLDSTGGDGGKWDPDEISEMTFWLLTSVKNIRKVFGSYTGYPIGPAPFTAIDWDPRPFGWSTVVKSYYKSFLSYLEGELGTVYAIGYDWTKDCRQSGDQVAKTIETIALLNGYKRVSIITHSMGGLVVRSALLRRPSFLKLVSGVIHIAQPVTGASIAYRRCLTGATGWAM